MKLVEAEFRFAHAGEKWPGSYTVRFDRAEQIVIVEAVIDQHGAIPFRFENAPPKSRRKQTAYWPCETHARRLVERAIEQLDRGDPRKARGAS